MHIHAPFKIATLRLILVWSLAFPPTVAAAPPLAEATGLVEQVRFNEKITFCGESVPRDNQEVLERLEKELLLSLWDRPQVLLWLKRSRRYMLIIERHLKEMHLPGDLKYVAVAESALRPHAGSRKGAMGFWQLVPETARRYGLVVDEFVDERRHIDASTRAALTYLNDLYQHLGSWTLAVAAYNMGEEGLVAEILEQGTRDYYKLYLSLETQRFVPRIISVKMIMSHPERFGFHLNDRDYYPPRQYDEIRLDLFHQVPIRVIAAAAGSDFKTIKDLNPQLRGHYIEAGSRLIRIPVGAATGFKERFDDLARKQAHDQQQRVYIVRKGDNLSTIAARFRVPLAALIIWNRLELRQDIHPGDRLVINPRELKEIPLD
jgi:membrane-bound lytic murein transglycosylase D